MAPTHTEGLSMRRSESHASSQRSDFETFYPGSPVAQASIATDIRENPEYDQDDAEESAFDDQNISNAKSAAGDMRRTSFVAPGGRPIIPVEWQLPGPTFLTRQPSTNFRTDLSEQSLQVPSFEDDSLETSALLSHSNDSNAISKIPSRNSEGDWEPTSQSKNYDTTWKDEAKIIFTYTRSLIVTFMLQYSLTVASIFSVGHIGKTELGAVSLASVTANITCHAVYQGLATSLDTLCPQAYGSGRKKLVGLQVQRMALFLWLMTIPIAVIWLNSAAILRVFVPDPVVADLASLYLKILLIGAPGYAAFEAGKRFVQAQGNFSATMNVLMVCAPLNALMNWLFVWKLELGFIGAPIAVAITELLLPIILLLYVFMFDSRDCWGGLSFAAFRNWAPMIWLALPGLLMVETEFLAFEILTVAASYFSTTHLAAQSVVSTIISTLFLLHFPISISASTRIAHLIGAGQPNAAKTTAKVCISAAAFVGAFNLVLLATCNHSLPKLFTSDPGVTALVAQVLPLCAAFQIFDAIATNCNGILRGLGKQSIGGYVGLLCYYGIAMPVSFGTAFGLHWELMGLWIGPGFALVSIAVIESLVIYWTNWEKMVEAAHKRNMLA